MSSPSTMPDMLPPDIDRGPNLVAMYWTYSSIILVLLGFRFYARVKLRALGWDDWMMLITVILFVLTTVFVTYLSSIGGSRHIFYLAPDQALEAVKWSWISQPAAIFLFATGKASVAILMLRFIGLKTVWRRYIIYFIIVTIFIVNFLGVIFTFVQCDPPRALWTPGLPANCWDPFVQTNFNYFLAAWNIAADIALALLPISFIRKLNLRPRKKLALCILLGLGLIDAVFSGVKIHYLVALTARADFTWDAYGVQAWTGAEAFVMMLCGNIPPLQPLWDRFVTHKLDSSFVRRPLKQDYSTGTSGEDSLGRSHYSHEQFSTTYVSQARFSEHGAEVPHHASQKISVRTDIDVEPGKQSFV